MSQYCQFTGGGDIYIDNKDVCMVITNQTDDQQEDPSLSPNYDTDHIAAFMVEGKKSHAEITKLKYQLFADTILNCVNNFANRCKESYDEDFIQNVTQLW